MKPFAAIFAGQGSQVPGMGLSAFRREPVVRQTLEEASDALGTDLAGLCLEADAATLRAGINAQPALLAAGMALFRRRLAENPALPAVAAGHSLGEYTALTAAGVFPFADALRLVRERGKLMDRAPEGGMAAVLGLPEAVVANLAQRYDLDLAAINAPAQVVVSGTMLRLQQLAAHVGKLGYGVKTLQTAGAFHGRLMGDAAQAFSAHLQNLCPAPARFPVLANVNGDIHGSDPRPLLQAQLTGTVQWRSCLSKLQLLGIYDLCFFEPRPLLSRSYSNT